MAMSVRGRTIDLACLEVTLLCGRWMSPYLPFSVNGTYRSAQVLLKCFSMCVRPHATINSTTAEKIFMKCGV